MRIPGVEELLARQRERLVERLAAVRAEDLEPFAAWVREIAAAQEVEAEAVAAAALRLAWGEGPLRAPERPAGAGDDDGPPVEIVLPVGHRDQLRPGTVVAAIAGETGLLLHARNSQRHAAAFVTTNTTTTDRINTMDTALGNVLDIAERARTLLIQRLDPSLGGDVPLDSEIDSMLQEVAAQLNKRLGDRYLFAGSRTDTAPVELPDTINGPADLADIYRGDDVRLTVRAAEGVEISYGIPASDAFDLMNVLAAIKEAHLAGDTAGLQASVDQFTV